MNRLSYRIVFNAIRGQLVAVAESATSHGKSCGERPGRKSVACLRQANHTLLRGGSVSALALAAFLSMQPAAIAQVIADTAAPANQRPTVLPGVTVNIQTPSAAGVSRNTYSRFDIGASDTVTLNNNRFSNPWLATGSARVILNEVRSSNPSNLSGQLLVEGVPPGGGRADVVFANPSGIHVNGLSVFGAGRFTLTTGAPVITAGALSGFNITGGDVQVASMGLGVNGAGSYAEILSRSAVIGGIVRADQAFNVVTGTQTVDYATGATTPLPGTGAVPALAIDTKAWGGMYAGTITLLSTEAGVGVRNDGNLQANTGSGQLIVTADGRLQNTGRMDAAYTSVATVSGDIDNSGNLLGRKLLLASAGGDFNHSGAGLAQNEAVTSPLTDPWHTAYNIGSGMAQDAGSASQVFINAKQDVNLSAGARLASNASVTASDGTQTKGQVVVSAGRNVNLAAGSNLNANGAIQISGDGVVNATAATASSSTEDATLLAKQGITLSSSTVTGNKVHLETGAAFEETASHIAITGGQVNGKQQTAVIATGNLLINSPGTTAVGSNAGHVFLQAGKDLTLTAGTTATAAGHFTALAGQALALQGASGSTASTGQSVGITATGDVLLSGGSVSMSGSRVTASGEVAVEANTGGVVLNALVNANGASADKVTLTAGADLAVSAYNGSISAQGFTGTGGNINILSNGTTRLANTATNPGPIGSTLDSRGDLIVGSIHEAGAVEIVGASIKAAGTAQVATDGAVTFAEVSAGTGPVLPAVRGANVRIQGGSVTIPAAIIAATSGHANVVATSGNLRMVGKFDSPIRTDISASGNVSLHAENELFAQRLSARSGGNLALTSTYGPISTNATTLTATDILSITSRSSQSHGWGDFTAGAMSIFAQSSSALYPNSKALRLYQHVLRTTGTTTAGLAAVSGQLSIESGEGISVPLDVRVTSAPATGNYNPSTGLVDRMRIEAASDLSLVVGSGNLNIAPDIGVAISMGDSSLFVDQIKAGRDITLGARNGVLTIAGAAGTAGNPTAKVVTLNAKRDLHLFGSAVQLQAPKISATRDVNITSTGGNVLIDGVKSTFTAYTPKERVDALIAERNRYDTLIAQGQTALKAERDALVPMITTLSAKAKGAEHLGATIAGRNINVTSATGLAIYGADIQGSGTVNLSSAGVLPIDGTAATTELQKPVGTVVAGLSDFYEYGAAGTSYHALALISRPTVVTGQTGVSIQAAGNTADARLIINDAAVKSSAGTVSLQSLGDMRLEAGQEEFYSQTIKTYTRRSWLGLRKKTTTETRTTQSVTASPVILEGQNIALKSGGSIDAQATEFLAPQGNIQITAANALNLLAVDEVDISKFDAKTRSSFLGVTYAKSTTANSRTVSAQLPARLVATGASTASGWNTLLQGTVFQTSLTGANIAAGVGPNARVDAQVILEGIKKTVTESKTKESNYVVWQRQLGSGSTVETMTLPSFSGPVAPVFSAPGGLTVQVPAGEFTTQIQTLSQQPGMAYLNELTARTDVNWQPVKLAFDQWSYEQEGLTPAGAALLAVAVSFALPPGAGADLLGNALGMQLTGTPALMANAAFMSLSSQAAITFVNNKGNIGKTLSDLAKSDIVKATIAAALTAGVLEKIGALEGMQGLKDSTQFTDKLTYNLVNAGGRALTNTAINGGNLEDALKQALVGGLVDTAHGEVASQIKVLEGEYLAHKLAHALAGCVAGAAAGGECRDGAIGAAVGEMVAQLMPAQNGIAYSDAEKAKVLALSKLVAGATSAYAGGDAQTAITTAETAVQNNALVPLLIGMAWLADKAWTAYEVSQDVAAIRDGTKTVEQVALEKGDEYVTGIIIGNVGRYGVKAVKAGGKWIQSKTTSLTNNLESRGSAFGTNINWGFWSEYPKITIDGKQYAQVGERLYTQHAVDRMLPSSLGTPAGSDAPGRNIPPNIVDYVIRTGERTVTTTSEGVQRTVHWSGNVGVVTEGGGKIVVTVLRRGS